MDFILLLTSNLFLTVFKRNKMNCYCQLKFQRIRAFEITGDAFKVWLNFIKKLSDSYCFTSITITSILDTIGAIKIANNIFLLAQKCCQYFLKIYSSLNWSNYFVFWLFCFFGYLGFLRPHTHSWYVLVYKISRLYLS